MEGLDKENLGELTRKDIEPLLNRIIEIKAGLAQLDCL